MGPKTVPRPYAGTSAGRPRTGEAFCHTQTKPENAKYVARSFSSVSIESNVLWHGQSTFWCGVGLHPAYKTPVYIPVPPRPQMARPMMRALMDGAAPHSRSNFEKEDAGYIEPLRVTLTIHLAPVEKFSEETQFRISRLY